MAFNNEYGRVEWVSLSTVRYSSCYVEEGIEDKMWAGKFGGLHVCFFVGQKLTKNNEADNKFNHNRLKEIEKMLRASPCCCFIHTWLEVYVLTVPSKFLRAMSAYAERKAAGRGKEIRLNISSTHSFCIFLQVADDYSSRNRGCLAAVVHYSRHTGSSNLPNASRLAPCQTVSSNVHDELCEWDRLCIHEWEQGKAQSK